MLDIQESTLPNGLRVAVQPDDRIPLVGVSLLFDVGSRVELDGGSGFAHLFEHLMFQGSAHVGKGEFIQAIQGWGGTVNGMTGKERTTYYHSLPSHQFALGLWMEADRMRSLALTEETFENQRATVLAERLERVDNSPYGQANVRIGEISYADYAYAHPVIGYQKDIEAATLASAEAFRRTWYTPDNAVLAIAGDVDPEAVLDVVHAYFGDIHRGPSPVRPPVPDPPRMVPVVERMDDPKATLPALFINHPAIPRGNPDFYVYEVIEALMFRGPSSRLYRRMVVDERAAIKVQGGYEANRGPSLFSLFAVLAQGGDPSALAAVYREELDRLTREPVAADELERVHNRLRSARAFGRQDLIHQANSLGRSVMYHSDVRWEETYLERILRVEPQDIVRVARRDFDPNSMVALEVRPA